jgi:UDP-N-acetylmuramate dehydrogenase
MKFCEPMAGHTTFGIGGPVDIWAQPADFDSLREILFLCRQDGIRLFTVGNGSNILVKDKGLTGCVLNLNSQHFKGVDIDGTTVTAGAGIELPRLLTLLGKEGLSGLEFLVGIPATLGGAIAMNAGWAAKGCEKSEIGDFVHQVTVMDDKGRVSVLGKDKIGFRYRSSNLEGYIILGARLRLSKADKKLISEKTMGYLEHKRSAQELDAPSAGCIFKNPDNDSAGRLIDVSGLKGKRIGGAVVSAKHANFIINAGNATCDDVLSLMDIIRRKVKEDHKVELQTEVKIL